MEKEPTVTNDEKLVMQGKALIADNDPSNRLTLASFLNKLGYSVVQAQNGVEAVELFQNESPDIVLMEVLMPEMDGYEATKQIKSLSGKLFTPVILLTAVTDDAGLAQCIESGGDDFLVKPYSHTLLRAKIKAMERFKSLHREISTQYAHMREDEDLAEGVFREAVTTDNVATDTIKVLIKSAETFSGDIFLSSYTPDGGINVLLGDFTGHGLAAALGTMPTAEVFRSMTAKGFSGKEILKGINNKLLRMLPTGMFMAVQFISISPYFRSVQVCNCGMPQIYVVDINNQAIKYRIASAGLPLGVIGNRQFDDEYKRLLINEGDRILLTSDGVIEATNPQSDLFGSERLEKVITKQGDKGSLVAGIIGALENHCEDRKQSDDISVVEVPFVLELFPTIVEVSHDNQAAFTISSKELSEFELTLHGQRLKKSHPVPAIMNYLQDIEGFESHRNALFTILTELYVNSLDHGVLAMDSDLKMNPEGFVKYYEIREQRLATLKDGFVKLSIAIHSYTNGGKIILRLEDSGSGFDINTIANETGGNDTRLCGRGIKLVQELCDSLEYYPPGNVSEAVYTWSL